MSWIAIILAVLKIVQKIIALIKQLKDSGKQQQAAQAHLKDMAVWLANQKAMGRGLRPLQKRFYNHYLAKLRELRATAANQGVTLAPEFIQLMAGTEAQAMEMGCLPTVGSDPDFEDEAF